MKTPRRKFIKFALAAVGLAVAPPPAPKRVGKEGDTLVPTLDRIDAALARLKAISPGHVVTVGAEKDRGAIGEAVLRHNNGFNDSSNHFSKTTLTFNIPHSE